MTRMLIGATDRSVLVFIPDPASTDGSGKTGLVAANLTVSYARVETDNDVTITDATSSLNNLAALTSAHNDWGVLEVSSALAPGLYRLDIADAVFATGAWQAVVYVMITTSAAAASPLSFELVDYEHITEAATVADKVWDEARADHVAAASFGQALQAVRSGTAQAGGAGTITLDSGASAVDDHYNGLMVLIVAGTGEGQSHYISDYVGATKVATVTGSWTTQPDNSSVFVILGV